jgi:hypothetical protein
MEFLDSHAALVLNMLSGQKWLPLATWAREINWLPWKADRQMRNRVMPSLISSELGTAQAYRQLAFATTRPTVMVSLLLRSKASAQQAS